MANKNITRTVQLIKVDGVNFDLESVSHHDSDRGVHGEDIGNTCLLQSYTATLYGTYVSGGRKSDLQCALVPIQRTFGRYVLDSYTF